MTTMTQAVRTRPAGPNPLAQLGLMLQWQLRRNSQFLPLMIVIQVMLAVATVAGFGLLAGEIDAHAGQFLATGAPTITLIMVSLVMAPQTVLQAKTEGSHDWVRTLPVPREVFLISDLTMWTLIALPGAVVGALAGSFAFHTDLSPSWTLLLSVLLVSLTAASIGYAIGLVFPPTLAMLLSQVLVFVVMLFTPISYPPERLPEWAASVHAWLPLEPMAQVMRAGLASADFSVEPRSWVVLTIWCVLSVGAAALALRKRG